MLLPLSKFPTYEVEPLPRQVFAYKYWMTWCDVYLESVNYLQKDDTDKDSTAVKLDELSIAPRLYNFWSSCSARAFFNRDDVGNCLNFETNLVIWPHILLYFVYSSLSWRRYLLVTFDSLAPWSDFQLKKSTFFRSFFSWYLSCLIIFKGKSIAYFVTCSTTWVA